jgi:glycosyltransferase involved in cell wall biosynthesis
MIASYKKGPRQKSENLGFRPARMVEVELSEPLPLVLPYDEQTKRYYERVEVLVRLHTQPIGRIGLNIDKEALSAESFAKLIWLELGSAINAHLLHDSHPGIDGLEAVGLPPVKEPRCLQARTRVLKNGPFVSVVICTRDRIKHLEACLAQLMQLEYLHYEVIVVDNAPQTSATADLIKQQYGNSTRVRYVREDRPGLSRARNCGLWEAHGDIIAYLDDDERVDPYWLASLVEAFESAENVACVTGLILAAELETPAQGWLEQFGGFNKGRGFNKLTFNLTTHRSSHPLYPYLASHFGAGGNMAFRTATLRTLGGFDPSLGAGTLAGGAEEIEVFFRLVASGYTLVWEPAAIVRHFHRRDADGLRRQLYNYGTAFTAFLTRCLIDDPKRIFFLLSRLPHALLYLLSPGSTRNNRKLDYPLILTLSELTGMLFGPLLYLRQRRRLNY